MTTKKELMDIINATDYLKKTLDSNPPIRYALEQYNDEDDITEMLLMITSSTVDTINHILYALPKYMAPEDIIELSKEAGFMIGFIEEDGTVTHLDKSNIDEFIAHDEEDIDFLDDPDDEGDINDDSTILDFFKARPSGLPS